MLKSSGWSYHSQGNVQAAENGMPTGRGQKAQCVQELDDSLVLQFTIIITFCRALHRRGNRDIR